MRAALRMLAKRYLHMESLPNTTATAYEYLKGHSYWWCNNRSFLRAPNMAAYNNSNGVQLVAPLLPSFLPARCKYNNSWRITVQEALPHSQPLCSRCEQAIKALSVYMTQQHTQNARGHLESDLRTIRPKDLIYIREIHNRDQTLARLNIYSWPRNIVCSIDICIDRESPGLSDFRKTYQDLNGGLLYGEWKYGLSVPSSTGSTESLEWAKARLMRCEMSHL